ncbi:MULTISPECIES: glutathione S-transferase N-terminal domain-containing protein [unclassified Beijerinckia]|uniref:glutathione S-transferase family protein n=1 Tax=unclassified Beijerinckia TaxID=2638183 RepID=UPI00089CA328|nr:MULTISPECIES: glutathione S-transferase N-terminal domain-containing protein [unclassified Beijerinckia]MDH7797562.1 GST-like protein [Beijerinckia sp. GAS462]SEC90555.1 GST-like protein [Beijerinckia sp. 28-YEA-48]
MIDFYTWITPNGLKISIALEEFGLDYKVHAIDITKGEQFAPDYVKLNPAAKIPAMVDHDTGVTLTESGAILIYLAEKTGRFLPADGLARLRTLEWLMWQTGGLGPTLGYAHQFLTYNAGQAPFAETIFARDTHRHYETLNARLADRDYIADDYSITDMAVWPWVSRFERHKIDLNDFPHVKRWYLALAARPQVQRGYEVPFFTAAVPIP